MKLSWREVVWLMVPWLGACATDGASPGGESNEPAGEPASSASDGTSMAETVTTSSSDTTSPSDTTLTNPESSDRDATGPASTSPDVSSSGSDSANGAVQAVTRAGARCERANRVGSLSVSSVTDRTIIAGAVSSGTTPSSIPHVAAEAQGCQLLTPRSLICDECASDEVCAGEDECVPKPSKVSAGTLIVDGLLTPVAVTPNGITLDYSKTVLDPFPAYEPGAEIDFRVEGDVIEAVDAKVWGVPNLTTSQTVVSVAPGEPAQLEWSTDQVDGEQSAVFISFSVNVHGAVTGWIECVVPDTGEFEIPSELVSQLIDLGLSGFPRVDIERRSSATAELANGCLDIYSASKLTLDIEVDGLASCTEDTDCEEGQACSEEMVCE